MKRNCLLRRLAVLLFSLVSSTAVWPADLKVSDAWMRALPGEAPGGGYFLLLNRGKQPVVLVGASSAAFGHVMMHRTAQERGVSRMLPVETVEVPAEGRVVFAPGGYHLMLILPTRKIAVGERIPVTLEFAGGEKLTAEFQVRGPAGQ